MFYRIDGLKYFANFTRKQLRWSFFLKILLTATLLERLQTEMFSCQIFKIFKKTFSHRTPPVDAPEWTKGSRKYTFRHAEYFLPHKTSMDVFELILSQMIRIRINPFISKAKNTLIRFCSKFKKITYLASNLDIWYLTFLLYNKPI